MPRYKKVRLACPDCDGFGKIELEGEWFTCPKCHGYRGAVTVLEIDDSYDPPTSSETEVTDHTEIGFLD